MVLTAKQEEGLRTIVQRHRDGEKYVVISGYAGTGKSTLVKFAIEALDVEPEKVAYATFTGKAAEVLRKKGNYGACTLHRLLYDHLPLPGGGFYRRAKDHLEYSIVVVDEVSMVPRSMIELLMNHKVFIIFLGDPFQLPQIDKEESHDLLDHPHVFLDEVMRQAAESEIIQLTMKIRAGDPIPYVSGKEAMVIPKFELVDGCYTWADQVICATNRMRADINQQMRQMYGFEGTPKDGEKMICLRNYWDICASNGEALVNGSTGIIHNPEPGCNYIPYWIKTSDDRHMYTINCDFETESGGWFNYLQMDRHMIETGEKCIDSHTNFILNRQKRKIGDIVPQEFGFGYAITCHKAQGSQWGKVLVIEEDFPRDTVEHARWLYTACTRPEEKLVLVR